MELLTLILSCSPLLSPGLMEGIIDIASHGQPWAIYRHDTEQSIHPASETDAIATARRLIVDGIEFDAGLTQISVRRWDSLKLTPNNVFSPCTNISAAEALLIGAYSKDIGDLDAALSRFGANDDPLAGIKNGYVAAVRAAWRTKTPGAAKERGDVTTATSGVAPSQSDAFRSAPDGFSVER